MESNSAAAASTGVRRTGGVLTAWNESFHRSRSPTRRTIQLLLLRFCPIVACHTVFAQAEGGTDPSSESVDGVNAGESVDLSAAEHQPRSRRFRWKGREFGAFDYGYTAAILAGSIVYDRAGRTSREPNWTGGILFDDAAQSLLLGKTLDARRRAQSISGYLTITPQIVALVDAAAVPILFDRFNVKVAWYMSLINVQAMSLNGFLSRLGHRVIARERPDTALCLDDEKFNDRCGHGAYSSFPSGHTSTAFVGAGLVCAHHFAFRLYWHPAADAVACAAQLGIASTAGALRVKTGRHFLTDVIGGATLGLLTGFVAPALIYYRNNLSEQTDGTARWTLVPAVTQRSVGLGAVGIF